MLFMVCLCFATDLEVMFWNVENLFDIEDNPKTRDGDFMPGSAKNYTYRAYCLKMQHLADVINHVNPHILGMVEVENRIVLERLKDHLYHTADWEIIIDEGPDIRGIDPALMFRKKHAEYIYHCYYPVFIAERGYHSRPIMRVDLSLKMNKDTLSIFINHWSSRRGGKAQTDPFRIYAADILLDAVKEVRKEHPDYTILMTGDFNDDACDSCLQMLYKEPGIQYLKKDLPDGVHGTYYYNGEWTHFDHFLISFPGSPAITAKDVRISAPQWIREKGTDGPLRFYKGVKFSGGYSDHYPICLKLARKRKSVE